MELSQHLARCGARDGGPAAAGVRRARRVVDSVDPGGKALLSRAPNAPRAVPRRSPSERARCPDLRACSWRQVRADPDRGWELEPPYEDIDRCFTCRCEFSFFVSFPTSICLLRALAGWLPTWLLAAAAVHRCPSLTHAHVVAPCRQLRRHHCRSCGRTTCHDHSSQLAPVAALRISHPVRVCDLCLSSPPPPPPRSPGAGGSSADAEQLADVSTQAIPTTP